MSLESRRRHVEKQAVVSYFFVKRVAESAKSIAKIDGPRVGGTKLKSVEPCFGRKALSGMLRSAENEEEIYGARLTSRGAIG